MLVDDFVVEVRGVPAISTCVCDMNSRIPATRRFISVMVVLEAFSWRGLDGFPTPLLLSMPLTCGVPPSALGELLLRAGEMLLASEGWVGISRSLVYWFLPTRPRPRVGGRPVFLWDVLGGRWSGGWGAMKELLVAGGLVPRADIVRERGSGVASDSARECI